MTSTVENVEAFLMSVQGIIDSGKEVTFRCSCPLYFNSIEESFHLNQRMSVSFIIPTPDIMFPLKFYFCQCCCSHLVTLNDFGIHSGGEETYPGSYTFSLVISQSILK